jgi:hypothetical protein
MGSRRRLALAVFFAASLAACASCKRKQETPPEETRPPDHLAPNEVVEGKERAFGLPLPRLSQVKARFPKAIHVESPLTPEELVNFVRARVKDGKITPGTSGTQLGDVTPLADPQKRLTIDVRPIHEGDTKSEMLIQDTTPAPPEPGLTDEQRWQKAGFTPSGHIPDPSHLQ